jgi:tetratricopeptide (TPR) repeat protein
MSLVVRIFRVALSFSAITASAADPSPHLFSGLPEDAESWTRASEALNHQDQAWPAIDAAQKALRLSPQSIPALRALANALHSNLQRAEALSAFEKILITNDAILADYDAASYLAAILDKPDRARELFRLAEQKFPGATLSNKPWALINLGSPAEALEIFKKSETALSGGAKPSERLLAGLAVSRWQTGDQPGATQDFQRLIESTEDHAWATTKKIAVLTWPDAEKKPLLQVQAETLRQHPEVQPKK